MLNTFEIVVAAFSVTNKANWVKFLKKTILVANISPEVVFGMLFLTLGGASWVKNSNGGLTPPKKPFKLLDVLS